MSPIDAAARRHVAASMMCARCVVVVVVVALAAPARAVEVVPAVPAARLLVLDLDAADPALGRAAADAVAAGIRAELSERFLVERAAPIDTVAPPGSMPPPPACDVACARERGVHAHVQLVFRGTVVDAGGALSVTVELVDVNAHRSLGKTAAPADRASEVPRVARDCALRLLDDPVVGFTPRIVAGLVVIGIGTALFGGGTAALLWADAAKADAAATPAVRAQAASAELPLAAVVGAGAIAVLAGALVIAFVPD